MDRSWPIVFEGPTNPATYRTTTAGKASFVARTRRTREAAGLPGVCPDPDLSRYELRAANYFRHVFFPPVCGLCMSTVRSTLLHKLNNSQVPPCALRSSST